MRRGRASDALDLATSSMSYVVMPVRRRRYLGDLDGPDRVAAGGWSSPAIEDADDERFQ